MPGADGRIEARTDDLGFNAVADPRTRSELLAQVNRVLRLARSRGVRATPAVSTLEALVDRVRFLVQLVDELDVERQRQAAEIEALKAALATTQRAYFQARPPRPSAPAVDETWPE